MGLHPQIREALAALAAADLPPIETLGPAEARAQLEAMVAARGIVPAEVGGIEERNIPGPGGEALPLRIYRPLGAAAGALPAFVYFHGGGHVIGSLDTHDALARILTNGGGCAVVSVGYRKAPEYRFPTAVEDAFAALRWVHDHGAEAGLDPGRIAVGGDSAGGNLAAVAALMARDAGGPRLRLQLLVYPVTDYGCAGPCYERYGSGYGLLTAASMRWFRGHYLNHEGEAADWRASPLRAPNHAGLPPALIITAENDVLRDDGRLYAERLRAAGVEVEHTDYPGMIHAFVNMPPSIDGAAAAQAQAGNALRRALA